MTLPIKATLVLILLSFYPLSTNLQLPNPFRDLQIAFGDDGTFNLLKSRQKCEKSIEVVHGKTKKNKFFPNPEPTQLSQSGTYPSRFRAFGESCDPVIEREYYLELDKIRRITPSQVVGDNKTYLDFSSKFYLQRWSQAWIKYAKLNTTCNPRWLLECRNQTRTCGCRKEGFETRKLVRENTSSIACPDSGNCNTEYTESFRCVASKGAPCEYFMPPVGLCGINCQLGLDCYGFQEGNHICCDPRTKCDPDKEAKLNGAPGSFGLGRMPLISGVLAWMITTYLNT